MPEARPSRTKNVNYRAGLVQGTPSHKCMSCLNKPSPVLDPKLIQPQDDFSSFFESHFSDDAVKAFHTQFLTPSLDALQQAPPDICEAIWGEEWGVMGYEEDEGLGYSPDGVKRTLTNEQIEIFRHSELHALERQKEKEEERKAVPEHTLSLGVDSDNRLCTTADAAYADEGEEGEVHGDEESHVLASAGSKSCLLYTSDAADD